MMKVEISAFGGCHVAGYPYSPSQGFPALLAKQVEGEVVAQVATLQFLNLPNHLPAVEALHPSHVLLQLGNYEFSASLTTLLKQFRRSFRLLPAAKIRVSSPPLPLPPR